MYKKVSVFSVLGFWVFTGLMMAVPGKAESQAFPKVISIGAPSVGTSMHGAALGLAQIISERTPMQTRVEPGEFLVGVDLLRKGEVEFSMTQMSTAAMAFMGWAPFDKPQWGPQPIRMAWAGRPTASFTPCVLGNSKIFKYSDMKGKKIPSVITSPAGDKMMDAWLEYGGLTRKDVTVVKFADAQKAYDGILEGTVDVTLCPPTAPSAYKIAASPSGLRYLGCYHNDKKYWAIMRKHAPWCVPMSIDSGATVSKTNPLESMGILCALIAYPQLREDVVYTIVKAIDEGYEKLTGLHKDLQGWSLDQATDIKIVGETLYIVHPGAIKYFTEKGKWTAAHDKWQKEMMGLEKERMEEFKTKGKK